MSRASWCILVACVGSGCGLAPYTSWSSTGTTTGDTTTALTDTTTDSARCGDGVAAELEVCFQVERRKAGITAPILIPGDFDGDGTREYYADDGSLAGYYAILVEEPTAMVTRFDDWFADESGMEHMVYRTSARDMDLDGMTDLLSLVQYHYWSGDFGTYKFCGIPMRARPGFQFSYELTMCWQADSDVDDEPIDRFDGAFGDFDGNGVPDLLFAPNIHHAFNLYTNPGAPEKELFETRQELDLKPYALQDNIVTVAVDLDDDGRDDLVLADGIGRVWTFKSDPDGQLALHAVTETPVLPAMTGTVLAQDVDGDGLVDLVGAYTKRVAGKLLPGEFALARGSADGRFEPLAAWTTPVGPTQNSSPWGPQLCYVHLVLLDLDDSGYPALVYALPEERTLVVHPQVARTLGADPVVIALDHEPVGVFADPRDDGAVDLLVSLERDPNGTENDYTDDIGPFIDRYRLDP